MNVFVADDNNTTPVSGTVFYVDDVLIEESATVGNNFDGSTPNAGNYSYAWTGAVGNSTSTETLVYPSAPSSSGMVTLVNSGTADTTPVFRIDGYAPGFTITRTGVGGTGARLVYADTVQAGSYVLINPADGSVLLDGYADRGGQLVVSEFETLAGAESATWLFESPGNVNATLQVSMGDAWW
jgi:hypothetical protein